MASISRVFSGGGRSGSGDARFEGEYQSMRSAPCASAPSHPLHAMPPRITRNSDRPRASDRTMVDIVLLEASFTLELCHHHTENLREWDHKPNILTVTKKSGLDLEIQSRSSGRGGAFFLTSLFIELIDARFPSGKGEPQGHHSGSPPDRTLATPLAAVDEPPRARLTPFLPPASHLWPTSAVAPREPIVPSKAGS